MPVDEDINLNKPLSDEQIRKLEKEAERLEEAARKAEESSRKIIEESAKAANELINSERFMGRSPLSSMGGSTEFNQNSSNILGIGGAIGDVLPKSGRRSAQGIGRSPTSGISTDVISELLMLEQEEQKAQLLRQQEEQKKIKQKLQEQQAELDKIKQREMMLKQTFGSVRSNITKGFSFARNPTGNVISKLTSMARTAGPWGWLAVAFYEFAGEIYSFIDESIRGLFEAGGVFDIRKEVLDNMRQVGNLDHMINVEQGRIFFTSDSAEILRQGIPQNYNTRTKVNGYKQYLQEFDS